MNGRTGRLGQVVGLWLAEGDKVTRMEVTFTNNQPYLIELFHEVIQENLVASNTPRIAVYLPRKDSPYAHPVASARYRVYIDRRANFPYHIYRLSGVHVVKEWRKLVRGTCRIATNYQSILQGFFAGEGNVKTGLHYSRAVRIAQGRPNRLLEKMLHHFRISFVYGGHREYSITGRYNLAKFHSLELTVLHRAKHERFLKMMSSYRQNHFSNFTLRRLVLSNLAIPRTSAELASEYKRSISRLHQVLLDLKSSGNILMYHVNSRCYWVRTDSIIVISRQKEKILCLLAEKHRAFELARVLERNAKSVLRRLHELEGLGLVTRRKHNWYRVPTPSKVVKK